MGDYGAFKAAQVDQYAEALRLEREKSTRYRLALEQIIDIADTAWLLDETAARTADQMEAVAKEALTEPCTSCTGAPE